MCFISELRFSLFLVSTLALHFAKAMHASQIQYTPFKAQLDSYEKQSCKLEKSKQKNKREIYLLNFSLSYFFSSMGEPASGNSSTNFDGVFSDSPGLLCLFLTGMLW